MTDRHALPRAAGSIRLIGEKKNHRLSRWVAFFPQGVRRMIWFYFFTLFGIFVVITNFLRSIPESIPREIFIWTKVIYIGIILYMYLGYFIWGISLSHGLLNIAIVWITIFLLYIRGQQRLEDEKRADKKWWMEYI